MSKPTDIRLLEVFHGWQRFPYRTPIKFGGRVVSDALLLNVTCRVETRDGRTGQGAGSMPMGNAWAWPSSVVSTEQSLAAMVRFAEKLVTAAVEANGCGHPLEIGHELASLFPSLASEVDRELALEEPIPKLAQLVAASPLDAALHDAYGKTLGASSYNLLGPEFANTDLAWYLNEEFSGEYLDRYTRRDPMPRMPLYHLIGALDPLTDADLKQKVGDGLPETLGEWIAADGLTHLKIKLAGDDLNWDVERVVAIDKVAAEAQRRRGVTDWNYSADFNERCANVEYVLEFLARVQRQSPDAWRRVQYIEQPTHRDLAAHRENRMHAAAKIKPVVIDESLVDFESLLLCRELGYSGVALKACKGHGEALLMGAAAQKYGMFLCVQDLTCPGASFLHSASLAARVPTVTAIEGNARQYCPAGNVEAAKEFPAMFHIDAGTVETAVLNGNGLGF